nr:hypothetical protein [Bradyrhizobium sp. SZCCHNPS2010]
MTPASILPSSSKNDLCSSAESARALSLRCGQGATIIVELAQNFSDHVAVFDLDEAAKQIGLRCSAYVILLVVDIDTEFILEEFRECPVGEVEDVATLHVKDIIDLTHLGTLDRNHRSPRLLAL